MTANQTITKILTNNKCYGALWDAINAIDMLDTEIEVSKETSKLIDTLVDALTGEADDNILANNRLYATLNNINPALRPQI